MDQINPGRFSNQMKIHFASLEIKFVLEYKVLLLHNIAGLFTYIKAE